MASLQEYCRNLPTDTLEDIIQSGANEYPVKVILTACSVLLEREPDRTDVLQIMQQLLSETSEE